MAHCPECGTAFSPGARFCTSCGRPATRPVPLDALLLGVAILATLLVAIGRAVLLAG